MHSARTFAFGPFLLIPERQLLLRNGEPVRIGGRALDLLTALVERAGELISKQDLTARAWPTTFVEEANLKVNVGMLRRVLEDTAEPGGYIATVIGRGYRFVAPVKLLVIPEEQAGPASLSGEPSTQTLPSAGPAGRGQGWQSICEVRLVSIQSRTADGLETFSVQIAETIICDRNNRAVRCGWETSIGVPGLVRMAALRGEPDHVAPGLLEALHALLNGPAFDGILRRPAQAGLSGPSVIAAKERMKAGLSKQEADPARPRHG